MTRLRALVVLLSTIASLVLVAAVYGVSALASSGETLTVSLGDRIRLSEAEVGCRVTRVAGEGKRAFVDCRRAGALKGTYGTYFAEDKVLVVRYSDSRTARVVFQARHEKSTDGCR